MEDEMAGACRKVRTVRNFDADSCEVPVCKFANWLRAFSFRVCRLAQGTHTRGCITTVCRQGRVYGYAQMAPSMKVIGGWDTGATHVTTTSA